MSSMEEVKTKRDKVNKFLRSYDFMRLGQAINHGQWQSAAMNIQRMTKMAKELEIAELERPFTGLRQSINRKDLESAKQALAVVINKRVKMLEQEKNI